jgi:hypothetical protein
VKIRFQVDSPRTPGGRSVILNRTGCSPVDRADVPRAARGQSRGPGGRSAWPWQTVRPAQRSVPPAVDFVFLPLEFKCGQSARASRTVREGIGTVREVRVLSLTASNGKGEYLYSKPGVGEPLLAL